MNKMLKKSAVTALLLLAILCFVTACSNVGGTTGSASSVPAINGTSTTTAQGKSTGALTTTTTSNTTNAAKPTVPLLAIRMLDATHGWALTNNRVLKTADGGTTWQDVTPSKAGLNAFSKGDFYNSQYAWIVSPPLDETNNQVFIWYTVNGGQSWNDSMITTIYSAGADYPHFLSTTNGWLQLFASPGAGQRPSAVYHTTNGGQSWIQVPVQQSKQYSVVRADGLAFKDAQNGWITGDASAYPKANSLPPLTVTHDGGTTWHAQTLPALPAIGGAADGGLATSTPPVFFGNNAIMPVERQSSTEVSVVLYASSNGGQSWSLTTPLIVPTTTSSPSVYVVDPQHAWATIGDSVYATTNGGRNWSITSHVPSIGNMSFISDTTGWAIGNPISQANKQIILEKTIDGGKTWQKINYTIH